MKVVDNKYNTNFKSGLTADMRQEIRFCNVRKISNEFQKYGIETNFKENKSVAWCCLKVLELAKKLNLGMPRGIFVEDFNKLHSSNDAIAFCNIVPDLLYKNKGLVVPGNTLFFDQNINWERINIMVDESYEMGISPTNFFLEPFIHEFAHSMHEINLLRKMGKINLLKKIYEMKEEKEVHKFHKKFDFILSHICAYASSNPFEAVACDLSRRIIDNMNHNDLTLNTDFLPNSPYRQPKLFDFGLGENKLSKTIKNFWNGKFS